MGLEIELKLHIDETSRRGLSRHPLVRDAAASESRQTLRNIYFDTPELALRKRGVALRLRRQGRRWLQTIKCAGERGAGLSARPEWESPYDGARFDFRGITDEKLRAWLERDSIRGRLQPIFETNFTRRTWQLRPSAGVEILLMLDVGTISAGGRLEPISELELELASGSPADLLSLARALAVELAIRPHPLSKAERGYALFAGAKSEPARAQPSPIDRRQTVRQALRGIVLSCLSQLQANEQGARTGEDPEYVHQIRVSLRRLRSALRLFAPVAPAQPLERLNAEIGKLASALGEVRDRDVLEASIVRPVRQAFPDDPRLAALCAALETERDRAGRAATEALEHRDYAVLVLDLLGFLESLREDSEASTQPLREFAQEQLRQLRKRALKRAKRAADLNVGALHRLRIAIKRWRYALEFFAPLFPPRRVRGTLQRMTRLQDDLGLLNDLASAGPKLAQCAGDAPPLREAAALIAGWHGPRYQAMLDRLPSDIATLTGGD